MLLAIVPFVSGPFLRTSVQAFDDLSVDAFLGSLVAVSALVAIPIVLLGTVSPYAIRLSVTSVEEAGRVSGRLYAVSTLGSLAGVFLAALLLVPFAGTRRTFLVFAAALGLVSLVGLPRRAAVAPLACAAPLLIPVGTLKGSRTGRVIWEAETQYATPASSSAPTPGTTGTSSWSCRSRRATRRARSRSSATPQAPPPAPTGTSTPTPGWMGSRSTAP